MTQTAVDTEALTKRYGDVTAVDSLALRVPAGALFGFLGPNGAGKSTTLGCLTGLLDPSAGSVRLLGEPMTRDSAPLKKRIGVMPEGLALFDQLYPHEFLLFQARMFGLDETTARNRTTELLELLELAGNGKKPIAELSAGMRKRVAFAAALIHNPEVLFLDEPFESIDPSGVALMKRWLRTYVGQGHTVFLTSHVLETVERLCDEVAIIKSGKLVWQGSVAPLANGGRLASDGQEFDTLEALFLHLAGERQVELGWLK